MGWRRAICIGLAGLLCGSFPAITTAAGPTATAKLEPITVEASFRLKASHGYFIRAVAYPEGSGQKGTINLTVSHPGGVVSYSAPAYVTADVIRADLGSLGKVDVVRHPSGRKKTVHPKCLGGRQTYEPGTYEGIVEFNGEQGYTRARETRLPQLPFWLVFAGHGSCGGGYGESSGPGEPGARLRAVSFAHGRSLSLQVNKNSRKARAVFTASLQERRNGIRIYREVTGEASPKAFRFDPSLRTATLSPGVPFSGAASLSRDKNSFSPIWTGDLALDFPGRDAVPLAGSSVHASLVHARFTRGRGSSVEVGF